MATEEILLISSDPSTIEIVRGVSRESGLSVKVKKDIRAGVRASRDSQIVLIDDPLSDGDCLDCLQSLDELNTDLVPLVMVDRRSKGIEALAKNALYYLLKPLDPDELRAVISRVVEHRKLKALNRRLSRCTVEDFLRNKLEDVLSQISKVGCIGLYDTVISEVERALLKIAIEETDGNQLRASKLLGLNRNTVRNKVKKYKITRA